MFHSFQFFRLLRLRSIPHHVLECLHLNSVNKGERNGRNMYQGVIIDRTTTPNQGP